MSLATEASPLGRDRIRSFSVITWVTGSLVFFVVALGTFIALVANAPQPYPWDYDDVPLAARQGDALVWSAQSSALVEVGGLDLVGEPVTVTSLTDSSLSIYLPDPDYPDARPQYTSFVYGDEPGILSIVADDPRIWVVADGPWTISIAPLDAQPVVDSLSGTGSAYLLYEGTASSATVQHRGEGFFSVEVFTIGGSTELLLNQVGPVDDRISWDPSETVILRIDASDGDVAGAWTIDIEELAGAAETPASTPGATPEGEQ